jgi:hypothetical protein
MPENRPFVRADRSVPMHQIKPGLCSQDLEGIHLPSFRFAWKLTKLCRINIFVFESWQTADIMVFVNFVNFQANLNEGK